MKQLLERQAHTVVRVGAGDEAVDTGELRTVVLAWLGLGLGLGSG